MKDAKEKYPLFIKTLIAACLVLMALMILSCGTTAVKGTPVTELVATKPELAEMKEKKEADKLELAKMSKVTENSVFETIDGIPQYRIGPLDILEINSRVGEESKTTTVTVNGLGKINYSFLDDLKVAGLTPTQLDALLTKGLSAYIRKPRIDVMVKEYRSKRALALGEFSLLRGGGRRVIHREWPDFSQRQDDINGFYCLSAWVYGQGGYKTSETDQKRKNICDQYL